MTTALDLTDLSPRPPPEAISLQGLIEAVGPPLLRVLAGESLLDRHVSSVASFDPAAILLAEPDAVLLLAGLWAHDKTAEEVVREAARVGCSAVVVKRRGSDLGALIESARKGRIAVLEVAEELPWREFELFALAVIGTGEFAVSDDHGTDDELFALANSIATTIGGSVAIEDLDLRMLAYSTVLNQRIDSIRTQGILDRRVPEMNRNHAQYRELSNTVGVVRFDEHNGELARSAIAIRVGNQTLGSIWAIETERGLDEAGEQALVRGASRAALKILRMRNAVDPEIRQRNEALTRSLEGSLSGPEMVYRLSLPGGAEIALVGFTLSNEVHSNDTLIARVANAIGRFAAAFRPEAAIAIATRSVYVLLPSGGVPGALRFVEAALLESSEQFADSLRVAVGRASYDPAELPTMRSEVDDILRVTSARSELPAVAQLADVHAQVLLAHVSDELVRSPRLRHVGVLAMAAFDIDHATDYVESLTTWFDEFGDVANAAKRLGVHANTLRYRLRRIPELFDISLVSPDDRLAVWLQLRLSQNVARTSN
jgi:PucR C-terminal helix-turn-helix domain/Purine catabolism regulatory protein-like family